MITLNERSGSSFLGSLMSAGDTVTYVYEPFFGLNINGTDIKDILARNDVIAPDFVRRHLSDLFECKTSYDKRKSLHRNMESCKTNQARVIKTIRVRYDQMESWIKRSDIKVCCSTQNCHVFNTSR